MLMMRDARKAKGLTMKELGKLVGVSESAISQYETGKREMDFETLLRIGEVLDCSADYLLRGENKKKPTPENGDGLSEKDKRLITWFRSLPEEKQKAILISQDAPGDIV